MLQAMNGAIHEMAQTVATGGYVPQSSSCIDYGQNTWSPQPTIYWNSYPVYVCTDKTKKAIEVLKALQSEKLLKCDSVPRFIELVEKIAGLL